LNLNVKYRVCPLFTKLGYAPDLAGQTPGSIDSISLRHIGGDYRKLPFDDQLRRSSKMAAMATILDLVSIDFLTNAWVDWFNFLVAHWG
jgi:hypothetical protein